MVTADQNETSQLVPKGRALEFFVQNGRDVQLGYLDGLFGNPGSASCEESGRFQFKVHSVGALVVIRGESPDALDGLSDPALIDAPLFGDENPVLSGQVIEIFSGQGSA